MDVQSLIQDTMLDNAIAILWTHAASTERVPGCLAVSLHPFLDVSNCDVVSTIVIQLRQSKTLLTILGPVLDLVRAIFLAVGVEPVGLRNLAGLKRGSPGTVLDIGSQMVRTSIGVASCQI